MNSKTIQRRFSLESTTLCGQPWREMVEDPIGDYVFYDEYEEITEDIGLLLDITRSLLCSAYCFMNDTINAENHKAFCRDAIVDFVRAFGEKRLAAALRDKGIGMDRFEKVISYVTVNKEVNDGAEVETS